MVVIDRENGHYRQNASGGDNLLDSMRDLRGKGKGVRGLQALSFADGRGGSRKASED